VVITLSASHLLYIYCGAVTHMQHNETGTERQTDRPTNGEPDGKARQKIIEKRRRINWEKKESRWVRRNLKNLQLENVTEL